MHLCLFATDIVEARLTVKEKTHHGLKMFLIAHYYMWTYPRNRCLIEVHFSPIGEKDTYGKHLWHWIEKIRLLFPEKIFWPERFNSNDEDVEIFIITVDGTDCRTWEKQHDLFPIDRGMYSHKFKHAAWRYEIAVSVYEDQIVWVNGPKAAGRNNDLSIFRQGLKEKIAEGKMVIADRGYRSSKKDEVDMMATPDEQDDPDLKRFKSRARSRHESVNGRIQEYEIVRGTFRQDKTKHELAFKAVCVTVQYQIEHGAYLFRSSDIPFL